MDREFEYGPIARGVYIALVSLIAVVPLYAPQYFLYYLILIVFLGFGLRPFLVKTGLFNLWNGIGLALLSKWDKKFMEKRASKIHREIELKKYKHSRARDPRLPKNW